MSIYHLASMFLHGNIASDPITKTIEKNIIYSFKVAIDQSYTENGKTIKQVDYFYVDARNPHPLIAKNLVKGAKVTLRGTPRTRTFTGKDNVIRTITFTRVEKDGITADARQLTTASVVEKESSINKGQPLPGALVLTSSIIKDEDNTYDEIADLIIE